MTDSAFPRILGISGTIPGEPGVGGVILSDLIRSFPDGVLSFIPIVSPHVIDLGWLARGVGIQGHAIRRYETGWRPVNGLAGEAMGRVARRIKFGRHCRQLVDEICRNEAAQSADVVWAILDCPTVIEIATQIAEQLNKPLVVLIWDSPELLINQLHIDRWSAAAMIRQFHSTIRKARSVGVICEQMRQTYANDIGPNNYIILRHGIQKQLWADTQPKNNGRITIGFAGSITAAKPFEAMVRTLNENNWLIDGKPVVLRLIGSRYLLDSRQAQQIEYFGWRSLSDTIRLLSECSLLYLPQPFSASLRPLAELSFPTKLTTYLAAGRRVLLHAPEYASVVDFMRKYPVGKVCDSLESEAIAGALLELDSLPETEIQTAIAGARHDEFNQHVFVNRFRELVGMEQMSEPATATKQLAGQL